MNIAREPSVKEVKELKEINEISAMYLNRD